MIFLMHTQIPIIAINSNDIALRFTIGIMYGGK